MPRKANSTKPNSAKIKERIKVLPGGCLFCGLNESNELTVGSLINKDGFFAHQYCMLFASTLPQNGSDDEGLEGFLFADIKKELYIGRRWICEFCQKNGATAICAEKRCRVAFHLPCGIENKCLSQFCGKFLSFCFSHRPYQVLRAKSRRLKFYGTSHTRCAICLVNVPARSSLTVLRTPCCKDAYLHVDCVRRLALSVGHYHFRCPLCNDDKKFRAEMKLFGVHVPKRDASWELGSGVEEASSIESDENQNVEEVKREPCDMRSCVVYESDLNPTNIDANSCELMNCSVCGSKSTHLICSRLSLQCRYWECPECKEIVAKIGARVPNFSVESCSTANDDELIDVITPFEHESSSSTSSSLDQRTMRIRGVVINNNSASKASKSRKRTTIVPETEEVSSDLSVDGVMKATSCEISQKSTEDSETIVVEESVKKSYKERQIPKAKVKRSYRRFGQLPRRRRRKKEQISEDENPPLDGVASPCSKCKSNTTCMTLLVAEFSASMDCNYKLLDGGSTVENVLSAEISSKIDDQSCTCPDSIGQMKDLTSPSKPDSESPAVPTGANQEVAAEIVEFDPFELDRSSTPDLFEIWKDVRAKSCSPMKAGSSNLLTGACTDGDSVGSLLSNTLKVVGSFIINKCGLSPQKNSLSPQKNLSPLKCDEPQQSPTGVRAVVKMEAGVDKTVQSSRGRKRKLAVEDKEIGKRRITDYFRKL